MDGHNDDDTINEARRSPPVITFDYELYAHHLANSDLTEEQKREFLRSLWNLIVGYMSLGFEIHPVQQAEKACGKLSKSRTDPPISGPDAVECKGSILPTDFSDAASGDSSQVAERIQE